MKFSDFEAMVQRTAQSFRLGMEAEGSEGLVAVIDALPLIWGGLQQTSSGTNAVLASMLRAQEARDHHYLADLLEYELLKLVEER